MNMKKKHEYEKKNMNMKKHEYEENTNMKKNMNMKKTRMTHLFDHGFYGPPAGLFHKHFAQGPYEPGPLVDISVGDITCEHVTNLALSLSINK